MKYTFLIALFCLLSIQACRDAAGPDDYDCPLWFDPYKIGWNDPKGYHIIYGTSINGDKLAFSNGKSNLEILYLKTGEVHTFDFQSKLPANVEYIAVGGAKWCPYDNNRLLASIVTYTDTVGDGKKYIYGINTYTISLYGTECRRITPGKFGKTGSDKGAFIIGWLSQANTKQDLFLSGSGDSKDNKIYIYDPDTDEFKLYLDLNEKKYFSLSSDFNYIMTFEHIFNEVGKLITNEYLNEYKLNFTDNNNKIKNISWSLDSKQLALSVQLDEDGTPWEKTRFNEIWLIDVEKVLREKPSVTPVKIINLRKRFCMYSYGVWAKFLTDSTLAVSMFKPDGDFSYIYEISTNGELIKQLTFVP